jgi:hypothetical protein
MARRSLMPLSFQTTCTNLPHLDLAMIGHYAVAKIKPFSCNR